MASASGKPAPNADVILNKINLALARSQQLMSTWLPPDTSKDNRAGSNGDPAMELSEESIDKIWGNEDQDDKDLFAVKPELLGVGAELPIRSKNPINGVSSGRPTGLRKLSEPLRKQLLGREASRSKEAYAHKAAIKGKRTHDHDSVSKPSENKEEDDDEPSRTTVFSKPKKAQRFEERLTKKQARKEAKKQKREEQRRQRQQEDQKQNTDPISVFSNSKAGVKNAPRKRNSSSPAEPRIPLQDSAQQEASNGHGSTIEGLVTNVTEPSTSSLKLPHESDPQQPAPASSSLAVNASTSEGQGDIPSISSRTIMKEQMAAKKAAKIATQEARIQRKREKNRGPKEPRAAAIQARQLTRDQFRREEEQRALKRLQGKDLSIEHRTAISKAYANAKAGRVNVVDSKMKRKNRREQAERARQAIRKSGDVAMGGDDSVGAGSDPANGHVGATSMVNSSDKVEMDLDPNPKT